MGYVSVFYRDFMTLRIELSATNLGTSTPATQPTKLTLQAVTELVHHSGSQPPDILGP